MSEQEALTPDALLSRAIEAALALSAASVSADRQPASIAAYERACALTEAALVAAQALVQQAESPSPVVAQLVELSTDLANRVAELEQAGRG